MFRVYGKPPSSEFVDLSSNPPSYFPPHDSGRIRLYGTDNKKLKVRWADGSISEIALGQASSVSQYRNRVINGDFSVWQRGNSFSIQTARQYHADRFFASAKGGKHIIERTTLEGFPAMKSTVTVPADVTTSTTYFHALIYYFEGQHLYDIWNRGSSIVVSFLFKSNFSGTFGGSLRNWTDYTVNIQSYVFEWDYTTPNQTQRIEIVIPPHNFNPAPRNDENIGFVLILCGVSGSFFRTSTVGQWIDADKHTSNNASASNWAQAVGNYVMISQLQVEEGATATEFEYVPYEMQLLRCMRYWETSYNVQVDPSVGTPGNAFEGQRGFRLPVSGTGPITDTCNFLVPKRVPPVVKVYSPTSGIEGRVDIDVGQSTVGTVTVSNISRYSFQVECTDSNSKSFMYYHFIADAEI